MSTTEKWAILIGLGVAFFGVILTQSQQLAQWSFLAFLLLLLGWVLWRNVASPELSWPKKLVILALYMQPFLIQLALGIRTDTAINRWSASDWWRGGLMAAIALCTAFLLGMALEMRKAASREARPPIESNGAQA